MTAPSRWQLFQAEESAAAPMQLQAFSLWDFLQAPREERDLRWLAGALQAAVELEFTTIPLYLTAMWSVEDEANYAATSIREIVQEEMAHMAIAMNLLVALGPDHPDPSITKRAPTFPGKLPRKIRPHLRLSLRGLSEAALDAFIEVERADDEEKDAQLCRQHDEEYASVGVFYEAIRAAFEDLRPELHVERQLHGHLSPLVVASREDVDAAITHIVRQGEGSPQSETFDPTDTNPGDLAHVWRFRELNRKQRFRYDPHTRTWDFNPREPIDWGTVYPVAPIPQGGYNPPGAPGQLLQRFDLAYSTMLDALERAWTAPAGEGQGHLLQALEDMFAMRTPARELMTIELPDGKPGTYGPCFRYLTKSQRTPPSTPC